MLNVVGTKARLRGGSEEAQYLFQVSKFFLFRKNSILDPRHARRSRRGRGVEFCIYLDLFSVFVGIETSPYLICYECVYFEIGIRKILIAVVVLVVKKN